MRVIPIVLTLDTNEEIMVFSNVADISDIARTLRQYSEIVSWQAQGEEDIQGMEEHLVMLTTGTCLACYLNEQHVAGLEKIKAVEAVERTYVTDYLALGQREADVDKRLLQIREVMNNLPNLAKRFRLHKAYLRRKEAYVVSLEALIEGEV